eukprot:maker-scaffold528_size145933-snap-gene-0.25 protein:Tk12220 transcript:maker-scaffold528_size145933-snap-gene-0.25-mRNA-1 annotation:"prohormone convertase 1"
MKRLRGAKGNDLTRSREGRSRTSARGHPRSDARFSSFKVADAQIRLSDGIPVISDRSTHEILSEILLLATKRIRHWLLCLVIIIGSLLHPSDANDSEAYPEHDGSDTSSDFSNEWIIQVEGNFDSADLLALRMGYQNMGEVPGFGGYFLMRKVDHPDTDSAASELHTRDLRDQVRVLYAQQLFSKNRVKRRPEILLQPDLPSVRDRRQALDESELDFLALVRRRVMLIRALDTLDRTEKEDPRGIPARLLKIWEEEKAKYGAGDQLPPNPGTSPFNDLLWDHQWYMQDTRSRSDLPKINLNVLPVFEMGITGRGVRVCVLDDGLEHTHPDLAANYDPEISFDYNNGTKGDPDPSPRYPSDPEGVPNSHGTRCAGEIAMVANNQICGVGMAFNAKIGGIRMLDGKINDQIEGLSLQHAYDKVDIFTASWGPSDDGKTVEAPGHLAQSALLKGVTKGRSGKGIIYVWAAGNGGMHSDNCNCDGYTSSIYTISIAGIIALALEANPSLTWRDVQYLVVLTSETDVLVNNQGWQINGAGLRYNSRFGFGVMNAHRFVMAAKNWTNVPEKIVQNWESLPMDNSTLVTNEPLEITFEVPEHSKVKFLEHVEIAMSIQYPVRGHLQIALMSPSGSISQLLTLRPEDTSDAGFKNWKFMSVHFWSENPVGTWKLFIADKVSARPLAGKANHPKIFLHGIQSAPVTLGDLQRSPRTDKPVDQKSTERQNENLVRTKKRKEIPVRVEDMFPDDAN